MLCCKTLSDGFSSIPSLLYSSKEVSKECSGSKVSKTEDERGGRLQRPGAADQGMWLSQPNS